MRKRTLKKLAGVMLAASMIVTAVMPQAVMADSTKVVTLGADLSEERQAAILKYFGVNRSSVDVIYVNNTDERNLLSSFIPLEVIGTRTLSCAYVNPTKSGGIQVKTANLTWVTSNMIASALSTSGVKNCEVIAACPIPVSGTGALAGVLKAYETAAGEVLDATRKEIAAQEIVTTGEIAEVLGQDEATKIVNDIKIAIIEDDVDLYDDVVIQSIIDEAVEEAIEEIRAERDELVDLTEEQRNELRVLAEQIAAQDYNYEDVKETLQRVDQNVSKSSDVNVNVNVTNENNVQGGNAQVGDTNVSASTGDTTATSSTGDTNTELAADSILLNTDDTALGEDVVTDATTQEALQPAEEPSQTTGDSDLFEITTTDEGSFGDTQQTEEIPQPTEETIFEEQQPAEDTIFEEQQPAEDTIFEEQQPAAEENTEQQGADDTIFQEEQTGEDSLGDTDFVAVDDQTADVTEDEGGEGLPPEDQNEGEPSGEEESGEQTAAAPQLVIGGSDKQFNGFSLKLYTDGNYVPASGSLVLTDEFGTETRIDLADDGIYGVLDVEDSGVLDSLGWSEANEIHILTDNLYLGEGRYSVSANVTFAQADEDDRPVPGTETAAVTAEAELTYVPSGLAPVRPDDGYNTPTVVTLQTFAPEGTVSASVSSSDETVAYPDIFVTDGTIGSVDIELENPGKAVITAEYFSEEGESLGADSIAIAGF